MPPLRSVDAVTAPIGIVIPTYNRIAELLTCLRHLEAQTWKDFEVLIVDDGSTDGTGQQVEAYRQTTSLRMRYQYQPNGGPARARNWAIQHLDAPLCILIGDDIFPASGFVGAHLEHHRLHAEPEVVALGLTRWSKQGQVITPFMRWLDSDGNQFVYGRLLSGTVPTWEHFYTSNLSFKTAYLRQNPFDERFPKAAMEDIELGYRLMMEHGLTMYFVPGALADHLHPTTFLKACRRAMDAGEGAYIFGQLWPQRRRLPPNSIFKRALLSMLGEPRVVLPLMTRLADLVTSVWCPNPLMLRVLDMYDRAGYRRAALGRSDSRP